MSHILQLETSTEVCSVALSKDGKLISTSESQLQNSHSEVITLLIERCIAEGGVTLQNLSAIAVSDGPGSYTSLRVGTATAKGLCYGLSIPLLAIDSLLILAAGVDGDEVGPNDVIIPMIDARRMEVYTSVFDARLENILETQAHILDEHSLNCLTVAEKVHLCGSGATKFIETYPSSRLRLHHVQSSASFMGELAVEMYRKGDFKDTAYYVPNYFKAPNITKSNKILF